MERKSNAGDWLFLIGAVGLVCAYFAYENMDAINGWLIMMQTATAPTHTVAAATDGSIGAWMASNWGLVMLAFALVIASAKWAIAQRSGAVGSDAGPAMAYRRHKFLNVKLVR